MSDYFDGAVMAYRDAAEIAKHLADNLPEPVKFMRPSMMELHDSFIKKSNNVIEMRKTLKKGKI